MKAVIVLLGSLLTVSAFAVASNLEESNRETVTKFYELAFNKHQPAEAMKLYVGDRYIQHNPFAGDGKKPFIDFFTDRYSKFPNSSVEIKRTIVQGNFVVVHTHSKKDKQDRGSAVVDIFRLENEKIVEHWDVVQPIPEKSANENTMF